MRLVSCVSVAFVCGATALMANEAGAILYEENCRACHGAKADGGNAALDIRGINRRSLVIGLEGIEDMPAFSFTEGEIDQLWSFLAALERD